MKVSLYEKGMYNEIKCTHKWSRETVYLMKWVFLRHIKYSIKITLKKHAFLELKHLNIFVRSSKPIRWRDLELLENNCFVLI